MTTNHFRNGFGLHDRAVERRGDAFDGDVVVGRSDTSAREHEIIPDPELAQFSADRLDLIRTDDDPAQLDTQLEQPAC